MATTYTDGVFTTAAQHGDVRISRPLYDKGDTDHIVVYRTMRVAKDSYTPTARGTALAGYAGTRLIRETELTPVNANVSEFNQVYSTVPTDRTEDFEGSSVFPFPSYRSVVYTPPSTPEAADESDENLWEWKEYRSSNTNPAPVYVDYEYFIEGSTPTIPTVFRSTQDGNAVDYVTNGGGTIFTNATALNGEKFSGSYSVSSTVPSASTYSGYITSGDKIITDVQIERYMGDIWVLKTFKMLAQ